MSLTKKVQIILKEGCKTNTPILDILWHCPICGEKMGEPKLQNLQENGNTYQCDTWENPCGHNVSYHELKIQTEDGFISWNDFKKIKIQQ